MITFPCCSTCPCLGRADDMWLDVDAYLQRAQQSDMFESLAYEEAARGCPGSAVIALLAAELIVASVTPTDQEMVQRYLRSTVTEAYGHFGRADMLDPRAELETDLENLVLLLQLRHAPPPTVRPNACQLLPASGCGCERPDCGGTSCHRREPIECDCGSCEWANEMVPATLLDYQSAWPVYARLGWAGVIPLRAGTKTPPPTGYTGWDGRYPSGADCMEFEELAKYRNTVQTALRMPPTVIGLDVDAYDGRSGGRAIAEGELRWCLLPKGPWSSARDDGISGIRFFRVPDGTVLVDEITFPELSLGNVEIIQRHHRYAVVLPSIHPKTGTPYLWRDATGKVMATPPSVDDLPELPAQWVEGLAGTGHGAERANPEQVERFLASLPTGSVCDTVRAALRAADQALTAAVGSRHDNTMRHVLAMLRLGDQGHPGVPAALDALGKAFVEVVTADDSRTTKAAEAEFRRMREGSNGVALIEASPTPEERRGCRFCGVTRDPATVRRALTGVIEKVLTTEPNERVKLLRWASRKIYDHVGEGTLTAESAAGIIMSTAADAGVDDQLAQRIIAERLLKTGGAR